MKAFNPKYVCVLKIRVQVRCVEGVVKRNVSRGETVGDNKKRYK